MRWPWSERADEAVRQAQLADAQARSIAAQWDFIQDQVSKLRAHREQNHFTDIIMNVARGSK